ncbi:hypothetical protein M5K25_019446 [Dendrobium thyrsiflorum]|uniref:Uncharacterized protein n=1 Tax=Dendrobium thyrsiflorum TaxID=117978 RepID=A0ABD0UF42_DENTH
MLNLPDKDSHRGRNAFMPNHRNDLGNILLRSKGVTSILHSKHTIFTECLGARLSYGGAGFESCTSASASVRASGSGRGRACTSSLHRRLQRRPRSARKYGGFPRLINNEPLLSVIEQLPSTKCLQRRQRSSGKSNLLASRRYNIIECSDFDNSKQIAWHLRASSSSCFEIFPKTPIKDYKISKFTLESLLCDVRGLLSTGVLAGASSC